MGDTNSQIQNKEGTSIVNNSLPVKAVHIYQGKGDYLKVTSDFSVWEGVGAPIIAGIIVGLIVARFANSFQAKIEKERQKREDDKEKNAFIEKLQREYAIAFHNLHSASLLETMEKSVLTDPSGVSIPLQSFKEHDLNMLAAMNEYILNKDMKIEWLGIDGIFNCYSAFSQCVATLKELSKQMEYSLYDQQNTGLYRNAWERVRGGNVISGIFASQGAILEVILKILEHNGKDFSQFRNTPLYKKAAKYGEELRAKR